MKLMASGVIFSAAIVKSPSFSRSSSSTTTTMRPARIASIASSMRVNNESFGRAIVNAARQHGFAAVYESLVARERKMADESAAERAT